MTPRVRSFARRLFDDDDDDDDEEKGEEEEEREKEQRGQSRNNVKLKFIVRSTRCLTFPTESSSFLPRLLLRTPAGKRDDHRGIKT